MHVFTPYFIVTIIGLLNNILSSIANLQQHTRADKKGKAYSCLIILYCRFSNNFCTLYTPSYNTHAVFNINDQYF